MLRFLTSACGVIWILGGFITRDNPNLHAICVNLFGSATIILLLVMLVSWLMSRSKREVAEPLARPNDVPPLSTDAKNRAQEIASAAIAAGKHLGAKSAREAAEMTIGRQLTDQEWENCRGTWERLWT